MNSLRCFDGGVESRGARRAREGCAQEADARFVEEGAVPPAMVLLAAQDAYEPAEPVEAFDVGGGFGRFGHGVVEKVSSLRRLGAQQLLWARGNEPIRRRSS